MDPRTAIGTELPADVLVYATGYGSMNQPQLWIHGGNLHQSRHYSQFLSLQLKARYEGLDTPVYQQAPVHHLR